MLRERRAELSKEVVAEVGRYCRLFRYLVLEKTTRDVANIGFSNEKTLSNFEHGRANNIAHLVAYALACDTEKHRLEFYRGLDEVFNKYKGVEIDE